MKRGKTGKKLKHKTKRKGSLSSDDDQVSVSTSLPPAVEGQLRCFLSLSVSKFTWAAEQSHPKDILIRICWWGEQGQGTIIRPLLVGHDKQKDVTASTKWTPVRYPVCSGPKQFAAYLNDMGTLLLETVHASTHIPFGKALISEMTKLTASHPVNVIVPVLSVISPFNKLADIQVFIKFESVSATYNQLSSSIPTVDTGLDKENVDMSNPQPTPPPYLNPATPVSHPRQLLRDPFDSPAPLKGVKFSEEPPERLEYTLEPSLVSPADNNDKTLNPHLHAEDFGIMDDKDAVQVQGSIASEKGSTEIPTNDQSSDNNGTDWIGALLERGQRLREGLAMSTLLDNHSTGSLLDQHSSPDSSHALPGRLFKEILSKNSKPSHNTHLLQSPYHTPVHAVANEDRVIDLLMGDPLDVEFTENMSVISDDSELSEIGDPLHDESLLMDLFYKSQSNKSAESDHSISTDEEPDSTLNSESIEDDKEYKERQHNRSKKSNKKDKDKMTGMTHQITDKQDKAESPVQAPDPPSKISGDSEVISSSIIQKPTKLPGLVQQLGADTLTTLGRVNTARVVVGKLELIGSKQLDDKKKRTFFVEYHFPISSTNDTVKGVAMATEITRVASKKTHNRGVLFNHRSVFPVLFNESVLEHWCNVGMTFKIFNRESGQMQPIELGVGVFPLRAVLLSCTLSHGHIIELRDQPHSKQQGMDSERSLSPSTSTSLEYQLSSSDDTTTPHGIIGTLEVTVELGVDGKEVHVKPSSLPASTQDSEPVLPQGTTTSVSMVSRPVVISHTHPQHLQQVPHKDVLASKPPLPHMSHSEPHSSVKEPTEEPAHLLTLHSLLWIPDGKGVTSEPHGTHGNHSTMPGIAGRTNLFLVSRMFWCEEVSKSTVCWGTSNPQFGFKQVAPVLLTPTLLQRTCNNYMVIEVWHKVIPQGEQLIGIVKLPLHQLYLSFRDPKITQTLLKSKFPVICVDEALAINNPFTSAVHGELKVLLAVGTEQQISSLLVVKGVGSNSTNGRVADEATNGQHSRPSHHLDESRNEPRANKSGPSPKKSLALDHQFEITVGDIRGLSVFKSTVWGETDCYVKYHFPHQHQAAQDFDHEAVPGLKSHHTPTTLCVPDPSFQDVTRHCFVLPSGVPVQRYLLAAYSGSWTSVSSIPGSGGVPFELWRRYYYPNVRDQLVAKASLPVAKLCAMVTMQRHREPSIQTFSLPLVVLPDDQGTKHDSGLLEITVKYQAKRVQPDEEVKTRHNEDQVSLSVDVMRVCALKDTATTLSHTKPSLSYPADVGVNCYVVIKLPIGRKTKYITRTVARTFAPEFSHHLDIMVPLQVTRNQHGADEDRGGELVSLAEKLEMTEAVFEVWHQHSRGIGNIESNSDGTQHTKSRKKDVLLGVVSIPMSNLLSRRTGIRGWHGIKPIDKDLVESHEGRDVTLGGLQLAIKFEDPEDREAVIHAGRSLGWSPPLGVEYDDNTKLLGFDNDDDDDCHSSKGLDLSVKISRAWIPLSLVQDHQGPSRQSKDIKGYVRYKLYDKSPLCSRVLPIRQTNHKMSTLEVKHVKCFLIPTTTSLVWYLREESLEVQVWLRGQSRRDHDGGSGHILPGQRDRLVGSAFINLSSLVIPDMHHSQISGVFPLFKAGAEAMDGASIHVQVSLAKPSASSHQDQLDDELDDTITTDEYPSTRQFPDHDSTSFKSSSDSHPNNDRDTSSPPQTPPRSTTTADDDKDTFAAHVIVQEAHHLPTVARDNQRVFPDVYVTYQTSASSSVISTPLIKSSTKPVWEFQKLEQLPLATLKTQNLVFKVWHRQEPQDETLAKVQDKKKKGAKPSVSGGDYSLGFASVDLAPLAAGLRQLIGWYNIMDFNGEGKGQIKVGVVPLAPVSPSRCLSRTRLHVNSPVSSLNQNLLPTFMNGNEQPRYGSASELELPQPQIPQHDNHENPHIHNNWQADSRDKQQLNYKEQTASQTSSSFLFRQLRQNMQELDTMQRGLKSKLKSPDGSHPAGLLHCDKHLPHHSKCSGATGEESSQHTFASREDSLELVKDKTEFLTRNECTHSIWTNPRSVLDCIPAVESDTTKENYTLEDENLFDPKLLENAATNYSSKVLSRDNSPSSEVFTGKNFDKHLQATSERDRQEDMDIETDGLIVSHEDQVQEGSQSKNIDTHSTTRELCSPVGSLNASDSLEEVSNVEKVGEESSFKFTQELDSWLSSDEDEETKSPLTAQAFFLPDHPIDPNMLKHMNKESDITKSNLKHIAKASSDTGSLDSHDDIVQAMNLFSDNQTQKDCDSNANEVPGVVKEAFPQYDADNESVLHDDDEILLQHAENLSHDDDDKRIPQHGSVIDNDAFCEEILLSDSKVDSEDDTISKDTKTKHNPKGVSLPNFFMPTQQLENSMRALRLGAKLGYPHILSNNLPQSKLLGRTFNNQGETGKEEMEGILTEFSCKKVLYKAKQEMQAPLSSSEMDRIAKIFSSK